MKSRRYGGMVVLLLLGVSLSWAAAEPPQKVTLELNGAQDPHPKLGYGNSQWLYPHDQPQEKLRWEPQYHSDQPIYYAARYGDAQDRIYTLVLDESQGPGQGYDLLFVDGNNDNHLHEETEGFPLEVGDNRRNRPLRLEIQVSAGEMMAPYHVTFEAFPYTNENHPVEKIHANLRNSSYYSGWALIAGKRRRIALSDLNSNGLFNDPELGSWEGDRFFVDWNGDGKIESSGEEEESFPYGRFTRIAGQWYAIVASPGGSQVEISEATPPLGRVETPKRIRQATLRSPQQTLNLRFNEGRAEGVAGTYHIESVYLLSSTNPTVGMTGRFEEDPPTITIREGATSRLEVGEPLQGAVQVGPSSQEGELKFNLVISGVGGEQYRWRPRYTPFSKAGFEIRDPQGKSIARGEFEYG